MPLHRLTRITLGVPDVEAAASFYRDFGLTPFGTDGSASGTSRFATTDGGEQLALSPAARRRLTDLGVGVDTVDDLDRVALSLTRLGIDIRREATAVTAIDPGTNVRVRVEIADRIESAAVPAAIYNRPGAIERVNERASSVTRENKVRPRKLGHVVLGSTQQEASQRFFVEGVGFKISDIVKDSAAFLRCSTDHHNILVQAAPVDFLHHTSWQVDDVDEVGRGASAMLESDPARHVWGLGRHTLGSNFFWYLKDPAGNFSEYYSDIDCIVDDALWKPGVWEGARALYDWGPPPPASFLAPEDLAALMTGSHSQ